jgi:hypothetical protein
MIILVILLSASLLWAACGFSGLPVKTRATAQLVFPALIVIALGSLFVARLAIL